MACRWRRCDGRRVSAGAFDQDLEAQRVLVLEQFAQLARSHPHFFRLGIGRGDGALSGGETECTDRQLLESAATARRRQRIAECSTSDAECQGELHGANGWKKLARAGLTVTFSPLLDGVDRTATGSRVLPLHPSLSRCLRTPHASPLAQRMCHAEQASASAH